MVTGASGVIGRGVLTGLTPNFDIMKVGRSANSDLIVDLAHRQIDLANEVPSPVYVIHLAAAVPRDSSIVDNDSSAAATMAIDDNIFNACKQWQCPVIYASGCSLYEPNGTRKLIETDPLHEKFSSPYLRAKEVGDRKFSSLKRSSVLRIAFPVGEGLSSACVIGKFLSQIEQKKEITVFGKGTREQDFIDVRDIADVIRLIMDKEAAGVFNVASSQPISMKELAELISILKGYGDVLVGTQDDQFDGTLARYEINKATIKLGWKPKYDIKQMLLDHRICNK